MSTAYLPIILVTPPFSAEPCDMLGEASRRAKLLHDSGLCVPLSMFDLNFSIPWTTQTIGSVLRRCNAALAIDYDLLVTVPEPDRTVVELAKQMLIPCFSTEHKLFNWIKKVKNNEII